MLNKNTYLRLIRHYVVPHTQDLPACASIVRGFLDLAGAADVLRVRVPLNLLPPPWNQVRVWFLN